MVSTCWRQLNWNIEMLLMCNHLSAWQTEDFQVVPLSYQTPMSTLTQIQILKIDFYHTIYIYRHHCNYRLTLILYIILIIMIIEMIIIRLDNGHALKMAFCWPSLVFWNTISTKLFLMIVPGLLHEKGKIFQAYSIKYSVFWKTGLISINSTKLQAGYMGGGGNFLFLGTG